MSFLLPQFADQPERTARLAALIGVHDATACQRLHTAIVKKLQASTKTSVAEDMHVLCRVIATIIAAAPAVDGRADLAADLPFLLNIIIEEELADLTPPLAA